MKRIPMCGTSALLAAVLGAAAPALAKNSNPGVAPPDSSPHGKSYGQWAAEWFKWWLAIPAAPDGTHPALGGPCGTGQSGSVFYLTADFTGAAEVDCAISAGKAIFFPIVNVECSTKEADPFHGEDAASLTACATCWGDQMDVSSLAVTLDGIPLEDLGSYRATSPMYTFAYPADDIFGIGDGPGTADSVADGYWIMLPPLSAGTHTLSFSGQFVLPTGNECGLGAEGPVSFGFGANYNLTVGN